MLALAGALLWLPTRGGGQQAGITEQGLVSGAPSEIRWENLSRSASAVPTAAHSGPPFSDVDPRTLGVLKRQLFEPPEHPLYTARQDASAIPSRALHQEAPMAAFIGSNFEGVDNT